MDVNHELAGLIHEVNTSIHVWMHHGDIHNRRIDQPNMKVDKLSATKDDPEHFALILKDGSIPVFIKPLTGPLEDTVLTVTHTGRIFTIHFKSGDTLRLILPEKQHV